MILVLMLNRGKSIIAGYFVSLFVMLTVINNSDLQVIAFQTHDNNDNQWNVVQPLNKNVENKEPPKISELLTFVLKPNRVGYSGTPVRLPCAAAGTDTSPAKISAFMYQWTKDGEEINNLAWSGYTIETNKYNYWPETHTIDLLADHHMGGGDNLVESSSRLKLTPRTSETADDIERIPKDENNPISTFSSILELYGASKILSERRIMRPIVIKSAQKQIAAQNISNTAQAANDDLAKPHNLIVSRDSFQIELNTLTIEQAYSIDSGIYKCKILNGFGNVELTYKLVIQSDFNQSTSDDSSVFEPSFPVTISEFSNTLPGVAPKFSATFEEDKSSSVYPFDSLLIKHVGNDVFLKHPPIITQEEGYSKSIISHTITWYKNDKPIWSNGGGHQTNQHDNLATILPLRRRPDARIDSNGINLVDLTSTDEGFYSCRAYNEFGSANYTIYLEIIEQIKGPKLVGEHPIDVVTIGENQEAVMQCDVISEMKPRIQWLKRIESQPYGMTPYDGMDASEIRPENGPVIATEGSDMVLFKLGNYRYHLLKTVGGKRRVETLWNGPNGKWFSQLTLLNVTETEEGYYVCMATNAIGFDYRGSWLKTTNAPFQDDESIYTDHQGQGGRIFNNYHSTSSPKTKGIHRVSDNNNEINLSGKVDSSSSPNLRSVANTLSTPALIAVPVLSIALIILAIFTVKSFVSGTTKKPVNWSFRTPQNLKDSGHGHGHVRDYINQQPQNSVNNVTSYHQRQYLLNNTTLGDGSSSLSTTNNTNPRYEIIYDVPMNMTTGGQKNSSAHLLKFIKCMLECGWCSTHDSNTSACYSTNRGRNNDRGSFDLIARQADDPANHNLRGGSDSSCTAKKNVSQSITTDFYDLENRFNCNSRKNDTDKCGGPLLYQPMMVKRHAPSQPGTTDTTLPDFPTVGHDGSIEQGEGCSTTCHLLRNKAVALSISKTNNVSNQNSSCRPAINTCCDSSYTNFYNPAAGISSNATISVISGTCHNNTPESTHVSVKDYSKSIPNRREGLQQPHPINFSGINGYSQFTPPKGPPGKDIIIPTTAKYCTTKASQDAPWTQGQPTTNNTRILMNNNVINNNHDDLINPGCNNRNNDHHVESKITATRTPEKSGLINRRCYQEIPSAYDDNQCYNVSSQMMTVAVIPQSKNATTSINNNPTTNYYHTNPLFVGNHNNLSKNGHYRMNYEDEPPLKMHNFQQKQQPPLLLLPPYPASIFSNSETEISGNPPLNNPPIPTSFISRENIMTSPNTNKTTPYDYDYYYRIRKKNSEFINQEEQNEMAETGGEMTSHVLSSRNSTDCHPSSSSFLTEEQSSSSSGSRSTDIGRNIIRETCHALHGQRKNLQELYNNNCPNTNTRLNNSLAEQEDLFGDRDDIDSRDSLITTSKPANHPQSSHQLLMMPSSTSSHAYYQHKYLPKNMTSGTEEHKNYSLNATYNGENFSNNPTNQMSSTLSQSHKYNHLGTQNVRKQSPGLVVKNVLIKNNQNDFINHNLPPTTHHNYGNHNLIDDTYVIYSL